MQAGQEASITDDPKLVHILCVPYRSLTVGWDRNTTLLMVTNDISLELNLKEHPTCRMQARRSFDSDCDWNLLGTSWKNNHPRRLFDQFNQNLAAGKRDRRVSPDF